MSCSWQDIKTSSSVFCGSSWFMCNAHYCPLQNCSGPTHLEISEGFSKVSISCMLENGKYILPLWGSCLGPWQQTSLSLGKGRKRWEECNKRREEKKETQASYDMSGSCSLRLIRSRRLPCDAGPDGSWFSSPGKEEDGRNYVQLWAGSDGKGLRENISKVAKQGHRCHPSIVCCYSICSAVSKVIKKTMLKNEPLAFATSRWDYCISLFAGWHCKWSGNLKSLPRLLKIKKNKMNK